MICFYHDDMDGHCAGSLISIYEDNVDKSRFVTLNYPEHFPTELIKPDEKVYLVDLSFSINTYDQITDILKITKNVIWIDHHASSEELIKQHPELKDIEGIVKSGTCGALLTYLYFNDLIDATEDVEVPDYLLLVDDYDCWKLQFENSNYFKLSIDAIDNDALDDIWRILFMENKRSSNDPKSTANQLIESGKIIYEYIQHTYKIELEGNAYETEIDGNKALIINKDCNSWIFGDEIKNYPLVCNYYFDGKDYKYSFYSDKKSKVDCSKIAEKFGGGGHPNASGCSSNKLLFKKTSEYNVKKNS